MFGMRCTCCDLFPCLYDRGRRTAIFLKVALVTLHLVFVGVLFLFDKDLIQKTKNDPWYTALYLCLFVATLVQYFLTAGSSPGYIIDAMRATNEADALNRKTIEASKHAASSKSGNVIITVDRSELGKSLLERDSTSWTKVVMELYPTGTSTRSLTCTYCNVLQPPRAKHCHDCDRCVLQFDHHCVWLGTCIGQGNHCRFWWYITEETALSIWTALLYIKYLKAHISEAWWIDVIMIMLLASLSMLLIFMALLVLFHTFLILTNQTTYELVRRRRIPYMRGFPERVYPFSEGACRNIYKFCFAKKDAYYLEALPTAQQIEEKAKPHTCKDVLLCHRCC